MVGMSSYNGFSPAERAAIGAARRAMIWAGKLKPYTVCVICGVTSRLIDAHREDYTPPYDPRLDIPACLRCHLMIHMRLRYPTAWNQYREEICEGWRYSPIESRNLHRFLQETVFRTVRVRRTRVDPPKRRWLDEIAAGLLCPPGRKPGNSKPKSWR